MSLELSARAKRSAFSRKAPGREVYGKPGTSLVDSVVLMGYSSRQPAVGGIIHVDHDAQSISCANACDVDKYDLGLSRKRMGDCNDNAIIESLLAKIQTELLHWKKWTTILELSTEIADYMACCQNHMRRHSPPGVLTPTKYENLYAPTLQLT